MSDSRPLAIRDGLIADPPSGKAWPADLLIEGDTIRQVGPPGLVVPDTALVLSARNQLLLPGLINAHTHGHGALGKGLIGDRVPLELFLNRMPALVRNRSDEEKYLCALIGAVELVRKGCTSCYDMFVEFPTPSRDGVIAVGRAYADVGMRAVVAPMVADRTLYEALPGLLDAIPQPLRGEVDAIRAAPYDASLEACREILREWPFDRERLRPALAPTIPLHCSDTFLAGCRDLASEYAVGMQTHLAESKVQAVCGLRRYGKTLTAHLHGLGLLGPQLSAAHAVWVNEDDIHRLADTGTSVVHNPMSNLRLGSGVAPVRRMREHSLNVAIGTDATNTADGHNMFEALRLASYLSRLDTFDYSRWLGAEEVLQMATEGSARALGLAERVGRLAIGYKADIVFVDLEHIHYTPLGDPLTQLVFAETGAAVDSVMIGGRMILEHGRLTTVDETALRRDAESAVERLARENRVHTEFADRLGDYVGAFCVAQGRLPWGVNRHSGEAAR